MSAFFARRVTSQDTGKLMPTLWTVLYFLFALSIFGLYVGVGVESFERATSFLVRSAILIFGVGGLVLLLELACWAIIRNDRWEVELGIIPARH
jgi:hypothetical protein